VKFQQDNGTPVHQAHVAHVTFGGSHQGGAKRRILLQHLLQKAKKVRGIPITMSASMPGGATTRVATIITMGIQIKIISASESVFQKWEYAYWHCVM